MMRRVLTLVSWSAALPFAHLVESMGFASELVDPLDMDCSVLERGGFDAVFVGGHPSLPLSPDRSWGEAIRGFVAEGGGLVACRAATEWFEDWPEWPEFLGARLTETRVLVDLTGRPVLPLAPVEFASRRHPVVAGLDAVLDLTDRLPRFGAEPGTDVLAHCGDDAVVWTAVRGDGRLVVDSLAYDAESLSLPANQVILQRALRWVGES
ncbi:MAG: ThuA domain-containing protein [Acidimicrobiales bacterium]|nr:ThuA domain-containing protein [Acidimicrobiales bacterium]